MTEAKIQKKIIDYLEGRGCYVVKTVRTNRAGTPDILASVPPHGKFLAIEVKTEKGVLSKLQEVKLRQVNDTGGYAFVAYSFEDFVAKYSFT